MKSEFVKSILSGKQFTYGEREALKHILHINMGDTVIGDDGNTYMYNGNDWENQNIGALNLGASNLAAPEGGTKSTFSGLSEGERNKLIPFLSVGSTIIGDDGMSYELTSQGWVCESLNLSSTNAFTSNIQNQEARTENNMKARESTANPLVDLFFKIGASRGKDIIPDFVKAFVYDEEKALRIALWARDCRGGAGERKLFRDIILHLEKNNSNASRKLLSKVSEVGRFDDLLIATHPTSIEQSFYIITQALKSNNGLCAKWMPRKGEIAKRLAKYLKLSPKAYRKLLVRLTKVVETQMCAKQWDDINFKHVPSLAASRYQKAFKRNSPKYLTYLESLKKGETTINASVLYPYQVIQALNQGEVIAATAQWEALPNYMGTENILAMVDVSGSMESLVNKSVSAMDVAVSLGLYIADKSKGAFKDCFLTFSMEPQLLQIRGSIFDKVHQIKRTSWSMNTNLCGAFAKILIHARNFNVPKEHMPSIILILSDMQFDKCAVYDDSAIEMIKRYFSQSCYEMPKIVFWNLNAKDNVPVKSNEKNVGLVSGFSPSIMKSVLSAKAFNPEQIMLDTIMVERYAV